MLDIDSIDIIRDRLRVVEGPPLPPASLTLPSIVAPGKRSKFRFVLSADALKAEYQTI